MAATARFRHLVSGEHQHRPDSLHELPVSDATRRCCTVVTFGQRQCGMACSPLSELASEIQLPWKPNRMRQSPVASRATPRSPHRSRRHKEHAVAAFTDEVSRDAPLRSRSRPVNDAWIAACYLVWELPLATFNPKDFRDFAGSQDSRHTHRTLYRRCHVVQRPTQPHRRRAALHTSCRRPCRSPLPCTVEL